jgi:hypothetical protein
MPKRLRPPKAGRIAGEIKKTTKAKKDVVRSSPKSTHLDEDVVRSSPKTTHPGRIKNLGKYAHAAKLPTGAKIGAVVKAMKSHKSMKGY